MVHLVLDKCEPDEYNKNFDTQQYLMEGLLHFYFVICSVICELFSSK